MPRPSRDKLIVLALVLGSYALALLQRPGEASSDTKIDLHVDPVGFLGDVAQVWTPTGSLGHVQGGQYGGYLWPMGPFFAAFNSLGLPEWVVQRLWLGTLLALAACGTVKLLDALLGRPRGVAHAVAGALMVLNPYVVVFANRTSVTLLAYAALPWLLLAVHRGLRQPRRWAWPAAFALIVTSTGGGVNAAVTAWLLVAPLLLVLYEPVVARVPWQDVRGFAWRTIAATGIASIWWVAPVLVHAAYGIDFLRFTEQIGSIWGTTSLSEGLRLMGYWPSYLGVGYGDELRPYFGTSGTLLFDPLVVAATLLVPALALAGFVWTRRWRYGPFFVLLALVGLLVMTIGFPEGTPLRRAANFTYNNFQAVQFLRTTYKAAPLVAIAIAVLGGVAFAQAWARLAGRRLARPAAGVAAAVVIGLAALPLLQGRAVDAEVTWDRIPAAWTNAAADLERDLPPQSRAVVLPGQPFAFYRWGATIDPILPALTERPVAVRNVPPYSDLHAVDLLWTVDNMVQQQRLQPGQLPPLLELLGARAVITATDDDFERSGAIPPAEAAIALRGQGLGDAEHAYGEQRRFEAPDGTLDPAVTLPAVRRNDLPDARSIVRVEPARGGMVVEGSADGLAGLAAFGTLPNRAPIRYAGDLDDGELRDAAAGGASVVVSDSNRRRAFVATRSRQATGPTLSAADEFSADAAVLDPFPEHGSDAQTVAVYRGARYVRAPASPQVAQFPEQRPYAAFDGDPGTAWQADPVLEEARHWLEIEFDRPHEAPYIDVLPYNDARVTVTRLQINGGRVFDVKPGWNRLPVELGATRKLRVAIVDQRTVGEEAGSAGGLREVRVPGARVRELLRPPVRAERALRGVDLRGSALTYLFSRTTADEPFRRGPVAPPVPLRGNRAEAEAALVRGARDPETGIARSVSVPAARAWRVDGFATVAPAADDRFVDRLAGTAAGVRSSGRFEGRPGYRGSRAFDGDPATAWVAPWTGPGSAWLEWRGSERPLRSLSLERARVPARMPTRVRVSWPGGRTPALRVGPGGRVDLPRPVRASRFRLEVLAVGGGRAGVGIGEVVGAGVSVPAPGRAVSSSCGSLRGSAGSAPLRLAVRGSISDLDAGRPLRLVSCSGDVSLPAGAADVVVPGGDLRPLHLRLHSPAPAPRPVGSGGGRVVDPGEAGRGSHTGIEVDVRGPSWLVLGESWNRGWKATCDGRDLGEPQVVDAFANGWRVDRGCRDVEFAFAPQRAVTAAYVVGGLACLALLVVLLLSLRRAGGVQDAGSRRAEIWHTPVGDDDRATPMPLARAAALALALGAIGAFVFALRAGAVIAPAAFVILWRGIPARTLILTAGALLAIVVPALYLLFPSTDRGGYNTEYATDHLGAHWVAVAAITLLAIALGRTLSRASRRRGGQAPAPAAEAAPRVPA